MSKQPAALGAQGGTRSCEGLEGGGRFQSVGRDFARTRVADSVPRQQLILPAGYSCFCMRGGGLVVREQGKCLKNHYCSQSFREILFTKDVFFPLCLYEVYSRHTEYDYLTVFEYV